MSDEEHPDLDAIYEALHVDVMPDALQFLIAETIARLPEDIALFATGNIHWIVVEPTWHGATYLLPEPRPVIASTIEEAVALIEQQQHAPATERRWMVTLNANLVAEDADPEATRGVIAHEIAHAVLGHSAFLAATATPMSFEDKERATDRLATEWGFACWPSWVDRADEGGASHD